MTLICHYQEKHRSVKILLSSLVKNWTFFDYFLFSYLRSNLHALSNFAWYFLELIAIDCLNITGTSPKTIFSTLYLLQSMILTISSFNYSVNVNWQYVVVIARCRVQYGKYFPSLSFLETLANMRNEENICQYCTRQQVIAT